VGPYYVKSSGNTLKTVGTIQAAFARQKPVVQTIEAMKREVLSENIRVFTILRYFSFITAVAGTFGIFNNMIISYLERKRTLAILRSLGMTRWKAIKLLLAEGFAAGLLGGAAGTGLGLLILTCIVPSVIQAIGSEIRIILSVPVMLYCSCDAVIVSVVASVGPMIRTARMNLISAIQYE
jgi:putative ABC transport system permease protein